jgi:hypothetical protein
MGIMPHLRVETFGIYRYSKDQSPDDMGSYPAPTSTNLKKIGEVTGRITPGDSVEPDILGSTREAGVDLASMWIGFLDIPVGFEIYTGDWVINTSDSTRKFQIQFLDRYPGGLKGHHYECRLQTTEISRNG